MRLGRILAATLGIVGLLTWGIPVLAQTPPLCLPAGTSLPTGILPPGTTLPTCPPNSSVPTLPPSLTTLVASFLKDGSLPADLSATDIRALLSAPTGSLPSSLAGLVTALKGLAAGPLDLPLAERVLCTLASLKPGEATFPDLHGPLAETDAVTALGSAGLLSTGLTPNAKGTFALASPTTEGHFVDLLMALLGGAGTGAGTSTSTVAAAQVAAQAETLFPESHIPLDPGAKLDMGTAAALLATALGFGGSAGAPSPLALLHGLGLLQGLPADPAAPLRQGDAALLVTHVLRLALAAAEGSGEPVILDITPAPASPGATLTLTGSGFGADTGALTWHPQSGSAVPWPVSSWSDSTVAVSVPAGTPTGPGTLVLTTADGTTAKVPLTVAAPAFTLGTQLPNGMVPLTSTRGTFFIPADEAAAIEAMPAAQQATFVQQILLGFSHSMAGGAQHPRLPAPMAPPVVVRLVPTRQRLVPRRQPSSPCQEGCTTYYGPGSEPYSDSSALSTTNVSLDVPCLTIAGYQVCSGVAAGSANLGTTGGVPNGYFTEIGDALSGASLVSAATMDAALGFTYTPKAAGDWITVEIKVITDQVDGGVGVAGAGTAPVHVYATSGLPGFGQQEATVASRLGTMSASVASWPDLSVTDLAEEALTKLDAINDTAQTLWQLQGLPGELGTPHVATFSWSGPVPSGEAIQVRIDTEAVAAANGLSETEVNALSGVVLAKVWEFGAPTTSTTPSACPTPPAIASVSPTAVAAGQPLTIQGRNLGTSSSVWLDDTALGVQSVGRVLTWQPDRVTVVFDAAPPGASDLSLLAPCGRILQAAIRLLPPTGSAALSASYAWPSLTVSGQGFDVPTAVPGDSWDLSQKLILQAAGAGGKTFTFPTGVLSGWSATGFVLPYLEDLSSFTPLPPGTYHVLLRDTFTALTPGLSANFMPVGSPGKAATTVVDLGSVTVPSSTVTAVHLPDRSGALPGSVVVVDGRGFGSSPGTVALVPFRGGPPIPGTAVPRPTDPGAVLLPSSAVSSWSDGQVVVTLPSNLAAGDYALWVLHAGFGPWSTTPVSLEVLSPCPCQVPGAACPLGN